MVICVAGSVTDQQFTNYGLAHEALMGEILEGPLTARYADVQTDRRRNGEDRWQVEVFISFAL